MPGHLPRCEEVSINPIVFLLDMDGVLIAPKGYRASFRATINYFTRRMGFGDLAPGEDYHLECESLGITNEWDMVAICLATIINHIFDGLSYELPENLLDACTQISTLSLHPPANIDYSSITSAVGARLTPGLAPADVAFLIHRDAKEHRVFPNLINQPILRSILTNTRDVLINVATHLYQNYTLGSKGLGEYYRLPALIDTPSLLQTEDERLISISTREKLVEHWHEGKLGLVIYTGRPSLLPLDVRATDFNYAPEAEYSLRIVGLDSLPMIAFGRMQYLSERLNIPIDALVKPSPIQALAAIIAGLGMLEVEALHTSALIAQRAGLEQFRDIHVQNSIPDSLFTDKPFQVHVFEDAPSGMHAAKQAVEILNRVGIPCSIECWGVAQDVVKREALSAQSNQVFWNIDEAIDHVLTQIT